MLAESSTGEPLAGFPRYASNVVPEIYFEGIPRRADTPAANDSVLLVTYAVEKSGDTRTTTALAASNRTVPGVGRRLPPATAPVGTNTRKTFPTATPADAPWSR